MTIVVPTRIERRLAEQLDKIVERGLYASRSDAVRDAVRKLVAGLFSAVTRERLETVAKVSASIIKSSAEDDVMDVILFGSVARGDVTEDSDVDLLILVRDDKDPDKMTTSFIDTTYAITLATDSVVTPTVLRRSEFVKMLRKGFTFPREIEKEGVPLVGKFFEGRSHATPKKG